MSSRPSSRRRRDFCSSGVARHARASPAPLSDRFHPRYPALGCQPTFRILGPLEVGVGGGDACRAGGAGPALPAADPPRRGGRRWTRSSTRCGRSAAGQRRETPCRWWPRGCGRRSARASCSRAAAATACDRGGGARCRPVRGAARTRPRRAGRRPAAARRPPPCARRSSLWRGPALADVLARRSPSPRSRGWRRCGWQCTTERIAADLRGRRRRGARRARGAGGGAPAGRTAAGAADAGALSRGPPGRRAGRLPRRPPRAAGWSSGSSRAGVCARWRPDPAPGRAGAAAAAPAGADARDRRRVTCLFVRLCSRRRRRPIPRRCGLRSLALSRAAVRASCRRHGGD